MNGLGGVKMLPALVATVFVDRHGSSPYARSRQR
jgi:hypothetical protein